MHANTYKQQILLLFEDCRLLQYVIRVGPIYITVAAFFVTLRNVYGFVEDRKQRCADMNTVRRVACLKIVNFVNSTKSLSLQ
jgi:hypothetical protein